MTKFTKRDIQGYLTILKAMEEAKEQAEKMEENTTIIYNGFSITKGKSTTTTTWDMEKICNKFKAIKKETYGKTSPRKGSVKINIIDK